MNKSAKEVSGDFYDYVPIDEDRTLVIIADASGKGVPACMIITMTRSILRSIASRFTSFEELLPELNRNVFADTEASRFVTMALVLIDKKNNVVECARAGHTEILLKNSLNQVTTIEPEGPAIGLLPPELEIPFETFSFIFNKGNSMCLYSDGITEQMNDQDEEFGIDRLLGLWDKIDVNAVGPEEASRIIFEEVSDFKGDVSQADDQTLVIISRGRN